MKKVLFLALGLFIGLSAINKLEAQRMALRTNALGLATGNLNLEVSHIIGHNWSAHLMLQAKPFSYPLPVPIGLLRWAEGLETETYRISEFGTIKHTENYTVQPSVRYWTNGAYNRGLFLGVHGIATLFKYGGDKFSSNYRDGWGVGAGASVGYSHELSKRFNLEFELGLGGLYRSYNLVNGETDVKSTTTTTDFIPTVSRLGISLVYTL